MTEGHGSGCPATNGPPPGSIGAMAATTIGWAPLPPDDLIDAYDDDSRTYWMLRAAALHRRSAAAPSLTCRASAARSCLRETHVINRPVQIEGRRLWVNPGLAPGFIAGRTHVALHAYNVRPRVFGATTGVQGAVTVRREDLRTKGAVRRTAPITVQRTTAVTIQATTSTRRAASARQGRTRASRQSAAARRARRRCTSSSSQPKTSSGHAAAHGRAA